MSNYPTISVVVLGYNSRPFLSVCLRAIKQQVCDLPVEVLYVDNASVDGSIDYVRASYPEVTIIDAGGNVGYAGGNNIGAEHASGHVLVFVNPDTEAEPGWLSALVQPLIADATIGLTTSKIVLAQDPRHINTFGNDLSLSGITTCRHAGEVAVNVSANADVPAVSGAAFAIRSQLFWRLGGFDERFWMYLEDTDISWRARLLGYRCVAVASSVIRHHYDFKLSPAKLAAIEKNRYLLLSKNLSLSSLVLLTPQMVLAEILTWGWALLSGPRHIYAKFCAIIWAWLNIGLLYSANKETQCMRTVADETLLRIHPPAPSVTGMAGGVIGQFTMSIIGPVAAMTAAVTFYLMVMLQNRALAPANERPLKTKTAAD